MNNAITRAIVLLVLANLLAALSDVSLKILNGEVPTFQYVFIRQLLSLITIFPLWYRLPKPERMNGCSHVTFWRAQLILFGSACAMVAVTHLSLATATAMFYVGPLLVLPLSVICLKEQPPLGKVIATVIGFIGVLIVLRPDNFHWAAIIALGSALAIGLGNILIRRLPANQTLVSTLFWTTLMTIPLALIIAIYEWQPISWQHFMWIMAINIFVLGYHALVVMAFKLAPASQIALAEYSGLAFATFFGVIWFAEIPDIFTVLGIAAIVIPMMPIRWRMVLRSFPRLRLKRS
jgi:drug/metabolite transporter (DMT)-like permease